jgi:hypothetical protein
MIEVLIDWSKYGTTDDKTYQVVTHFKFRKGDINVMNHTDHVGLFTDNGWVAIWKFFTLYIKSFALQCSTIHNGGPVPLPAPDENIVCIYPILDTCGFSLIREIGQIL